MEEYLIEELLNDILLITNISVNEKLHVLDKTIMKCNYINSFKRYLSNESRHHSLRFITDRVNLYCSFLDDKKIMKDPKTINELISAMYNLKITYSDDCYMKFKLERLIMKINKYKKNID